jgi:lysophospholipase L1-like esterase
VLMTSRAVEHEDESACDQKDHDCRSNDSPTHDGHRKAVAYGECMPRRIPIAVAACLALVSVGTAIPAHAASGPIAKGSWAMAPQSKDANGDGFIDGDGGVPARGALSLSPSTTMIGAGNHVAQPNERLINGSLSWYLGNTFEVMLSACGSKGDSYTWTITGATTVRTPPKAIKNCTSTVSLAEGVYSFDLAVKSGRATAHRVLHGSVRNYVLVSMGDSYASGEGNPRNIDAYLQQAGLFTSFTPYWDDTSCARSTHSAPARAALALEKSSPHSSVTLIDVSCSGATIGSGILGPQSRAGQSASQVEQARAIADGHRIDAITLSVGGNDIGFGAILQACATKANCPTQPSTTPPLKGYPTIQAGAQANLATLPGKYASVNAALASLAPGAPVFPTMYPDITRAADGSPCTYLTMGPSDFAWARATLLVPDPQSPYSYATTSGTTVPMALPAGTLNSQIAATHGALGWSDVAGTWGASGNSSVGHGVCAGDQAWTFGLISLGPLAAAAFHPNPKGLDVMGKAIATALGSAIH